MSRAISKIFNSVDMSFCADAFSRVALMKDETLTPWCN